MKYYFDFLINHVKNGKAILSPQAGKQAVDRIWPGGVGGVVH